MKITDVRIRLVEKDGIKLKAAASITFDECFVIHDIKVIDGTNGLFISMPSRKTPNGEFKDIVHPLNTPTRQYLEETVLEAYKKEAELAKADTKTEVPLTNEVNETE